MTPVPLPQDLPTAIGFDAPCFAALTVAVIISLRSPNGYSRFGCHVISNEFASRPIRMRPDGDGDGERERERES